MESLFVNLYQNKGNIFIFTEEYCYSDINVSTIDKIIYFYYANKYIFKDEIIIIERLENNIKIYIERSIKINNEHLNIGINVINTQNSNVTVKSIIKYFLGNIPNIKEYGIYIISTINDIIYDNIKVKSSIKNNYNIILYKKYFKNTKEKPEEKRIKYENKIIGEIKIKNIKNSFNRIKEEIKRENRYLLDIASKKDIYESKIIGQFNNQFIITYNNNKIYIIDQHAIHERIRYEQLYYGDDDINKKRACAGAIKFGDKLNLFQMKNLLVGFKICKYPFKCIHGRPTIISVIE